MVLQQITEYDKAASQDQRSPTRKLFAFYLRAALVLDERASVLEAIELPNQDGGWTAATRTAIHAHGVVPTALLHADFSEFFKNESTSTRSTSEGQPDSTGRSNHGSSVGLLRDYFEPWRHRVPLTPIGAFLALLGPDPAIVELAAQYLQEGQRDLPTTLELIAGSRDRAAPGTGRFTEIRGRHRFAVTLAEGKAVQLTAVMLQLVLGMTSPSLFTDLFADGASVPNEKLSNWFDRKTMTFGGQDVVDT